MTTSWARSVLTLATALPLAAGLLVAAAPAASAAITSPGDGTVFTSYSTFSIQGTYAASGTENRLTLTSPGGPTVTIATAPADRVNGGSFPPYSLDTGCWTFPSSSCSGRRLAPNGTWTVAQNDGSRATFVTRIRPEAPRTVSAGALSPREARVSWRVGDEPDLTGWAVLEGGEVVANGIGRSACDGGTCSTVITYATEGSGEHTYTVKAFRSTAPGSSSTLESAPSAPASTTLESPPPPPPPPSEEPAPEGGGTGGGSSGEGGGSGGDGGSTGGSGSGSGSGTSGSGSGTSGGGSSGGTSGGSTGGGDSGGTGGGGTGGGGTGGPSGGRPVIGTGTSDAGPTADEQAVSQRKAFALSFSAFGPKLGIPKLPPLPQAPAPAIAPELPDGTYEPTLGFEDQVLTERVPVAQSPTERVRDVVGTALDSDRLIRSTAGALVLLLVGAHLRRWLGSAAEE